MFASCEVASGDGLAGKRAYSGGAGRAVDHGKKMCRWRVSERSADGQWGLNEVMAKWGDEEWCGKPDNVSPVAAMADCMWNLRYLRDSLAGAVHYIRAAERG